MSENGLFTHAQYCCGCNVQLADYTGKPLMEIHERLFDASHDEDGGLVLITELYCAECFNEED